MDNDIIARLRERTVPRGYKFHTWQLGNLLSHDQRELIIRVNNRENRNSD